MSTIAVLGIQWGDEGKGKIVDALCRNAKLCGRFNGGANAGHTLRVNGHSIALHLLPCGVLNPSTLNLIGSGVVIHLPTLAEELDKLSAALSGANVDQRILISSRSHLTFDYHRLADAVGERKLANRSIGTTLRGIGPSYASKALRLSLRAADLRGSFDRFREMYIEQGQFIAQAFGLSDWDPEAELTLLKPLVERFAPLVTDAASLLRELLGTDPVPLPPTKSMISHNWQVVIEGANATMLDLNCGTYPYVTSSDTLLGGVNGGLGLNPRRVDFVLGVCKAYCTRVGEGPFPTELENDTGKFLQVEGHEFGASTGRPRRCGWLDIPQLRYAQWLSDCDALMITKLDVLTGLPKIRVAVEYRDALGHFVPHGLFPASLEELSTYACEYEVFEGWNEPLDKIKEYSKLPRQAKVLIERVETLMKVPVILLGVGPEREAIIAK